MNAFAPLEEKGEFLLECLAVRRETATASTYIFAAPPAPFTFEPGQFLNFAFDIDGEEHLRSYSISSSAIVSGWVAVTVKRVSGGRVSNWLHDCMRPGVKVRASGPAGQFGCGLEPMGPVLLLTAGSGITPAASMIRSLADHTSQTDVSLIHFASSAEDMIFRDEMLHWSKVLPGLRVVPVLTRHSPGSGWIGPIARLSRELLLGLVPDVTARTVYCCGPAAFMDLAAVTLRQIGLPEDKFLTESFDSFREEETAFVEDGTAIKHTITFEKSGLTGKIDAETTVLKAARAIGGRIQSSCGKGVCGTCRVKMLSGSVEMKHQGGIRQREIDSGFILACCSRPTSDIVIDK
ncbi:ferredoxin (plasmid) [Rhizobium freirei PRF 81]|uniref:Ferredoxin n=1 Tax=Rhizobium freirei PRF 81 TaxID=363754 RepID=N6TTT7_9HYPH|nr:hybrid-cluster NAD(P)-dependent oxidoreductase [Rhizobium freirei]ENN83889.1 ferredoxin [Rhizobium freirei PRF 81]